MEDKPWLVFSTIPSAKRCSQTMSNTLFGGFPCEPTGADHMSLCLNGAPLWGRHTQALTHGLSPESPQWDNVAEQVSQ